MNKLPRCVLTFLIICAIMIIALPVYAQVAYPNVRFTIDQLEAYANNLEIGDQLYIVTATIDNSVTPSEPISDTYIVRLLDAAGAELGTATFYSYFDNGYNQGIASIYFDAASAPVWNGAYSVEVTGNPTLHWLAASATHAMTYAKSYDQGVATYTDETAEANSAAANDMTILTTENDDAYYFGSSRMFNLLTVNVGTNGNWAGSYDYEYWDGSAWVSVSGLADATTGFTAGTGVRDITWTCPTDWQQTTVDGDSAYWVRFRVTSWTSLTTPALGTQSWTNTMDAPPSITSNVFSLWYDDGTLAGTSERLTTRLRAIASILETKWGGTTDLIESIAGVQKLTDEGEDYFTNSIDNLRDICPDLFAALISNPDFSQDVLVTDGYSSGADADTDVFGVNWYAQTFTTSEAYDITGLRFRAYIVGAPGTLTASIRATVAGLPSGADLASGTLAAATLSTDTDGEWAEIIFTSDEALTSGTTYALILRATAGNAANYVAWMNDSTGAYTGGQAATSVNSGVAWAANAGTDYLFQVLARDAHNLSYRNRLAAQLIGTVFDMTNLGNNLGMSRMWTSTIIWFIAIIALAVFFSRMARTYKLITLFITLTAPFGALFGFIYLEVAIIATFLMALGTIYVFLFRGTP